MTMSKSEQRKVLAKQFMKYTSAVPAGSAVSGTTVGDVFINQWGDSTWGDPYGAKTDAERLQRRVKELEESHYFLKSEMERYRLLSLMERQEAQENLAAVKAGHIAFQDKIQEELRLERVKVAQLETEKRMLLQAMSNLGIGVDVKQQQGENNE